MIGKNKAVTFSTKGQGFEFLVYLEPVVFPKHHKCISFSFVLELPSSLRLKSQITDRLASTA